MGQHPGGVRSKGYLLRQHHFLIPYHPSGQIIIFHQHRFPLKCLGISQTKLNHHFGGFRSFEVAIIWPNVWYIYLHCTITDCSYIHNMYPRILRVMINNLPTWFFPQPRKRRVVCNKSGWNDKDSPSCDRNVYQCKIGPWEQFFEWGPTNGIEKVVSLGL